MNKVSLLAASVAIALTGCGGSDSGSNSASNGVVITGFDGYFKNAVVFEDTNNNGQWDTQESILGLTDEKGQLTLAAKPEKNLSTANSRSKRCETETTYRLGCQEIRWHLHRRYGPPKPSYGARNRIPRTIIV